MGDDPTQMTYFDDDTRVRSSSVTSLPAAPSAPSYMNAFKGWFSRKPAQEYATVQQSEPPVPVEPHAPATEPAIQQAKPPQLQTSTKHLTAPQAQRAPPSAASASSPRDSTTHSPPSTSALPSRRNSLSHSTQAQANDVLSITSSDEQFGGSQKV